MDCQSALSTSYDSAAAAEATARPISLDLVLCAPSIAMSRHPFLDSDFLACLSFPATLACFSCLVDVFASRSRCICR